MAESSVLSSVVHTSWTPLCSAFICNEMPIPELCP